MIYELRLYTVTPGRLPDMKSRFLDRLPRLFDRHGIDSPGRWLCFGGARGPLWIYALRYADLATREQVWRSFLGDDDWWAVRQTTNGGEEMVEHFQLDLLTANRLDPGVADWCTGRHQELLYIDQPLGLTAQSLAFLAETYLPLLQERGARVVLGADFLTGERLPRTALLLEWADAATRFGAHEDVTASPIFGDALREQRRQYRTSLMGAIDSYVLRPVALGDG